MTGRYSGTATIVNWCLILFICAVIVACDNTENSELPIPGGLSPDQPTPNQPSPNQPPINNTTVTLSGNITIAPGSFVDGDVNDPNAAYQSNDILSEAQAIPNPTILGGYVNVAGAGLTGRSFQAGDSDDYYIVQLFSNQSISITVADYNLPTAQPNRIALFLLGQNGEVILHTTGDRQTDFLNINTDGIYYLRVFALSGASNYTLTIGLSAQQQGGSNSTLKVDQDFVPGDVIVEYKQDNPTSTRQVTGIQSAATIARSLGLAYKSGDIKRNMLMKLESGAGQGNTLSVLGVQRINQASNAKAQLKLDTIEVVKALRKRPDIVSARLNYIRQAFRVPNDEYYNYQWHYPQINLPQAWDITTGNSDVVVAVIDTGVLLDHPDLQGQLVPGYDFISDPGNAADGDGIDNNPNDDGDDPNGNSSFHGTHVSGTIAAASNTNVGVSGVAWGAKVMPLRALGRLGGTDYDIEQAVRFAAQLPNDSGTVPNQKADVINLSLGGPTNSTIAPEAYRLAREAGVVIVAASGNEASSGINYPASLDGVVSVSATNINNTLAPYSNFGSTIDIAAPGGDFSDVNGDGFADGILSTAASDANGMLQFGYAFFQGTSMAAPHIAGIVALMKSANNSLTPDEFDQLLANGDITEDLGDTGRDNQFGYGLVDAYKAVTAAGNLVNTPIEPRSPLAEAQPAALNFGATGVSMELNISNAGDGEIEVIQIGNDSNGWLSVTEVSVDNNGVGRYIVQVDRQALPQVTQAYSTTITITTSVNTVSVPVLMQVYVENFVDNAGFHYALLRDSTTQEILQKVEALLVGSQYQFTFSSVSPGTYTISAGTDTDNDGVLCEIAEACGVYIMPTFIEPIVVGNESGNRNGINFETSFDNVINVGSTELPMIKLNQSLY